MMSGYHPPVPEALAPYRDRVEELLGVGVPLEEIERELIDRVALDEEHRSALWLYAWAVAGRSGAAARGTAADRRA